MPKFKTQQRKSTKNHYQVLGISPQATKKEIKTAFYELAKLYHPDRQNNRSNCANSSELITDSNQFHQINESYSVLIDNKKRQRYNQILILKHKIHKQKQLLKKSIHTTQVHNLKKQQKKYITTKIKISLPLKKYLSFIAICCLAILSFTIIYLKIVSVHNQQDIILSPTNPPASVYMLYPQERLHANYSLVNGLNVYQYSTTDSDILTKLEKFHTVFASNLPDKGWLKIQTSHEITGYVLEKYLGFGDGEFASKIQCDTYPEVRPKSITLLQNIYGNKNLIIRNTDKRDMLFRLKDKFKNPIIIAYVQGNSQAILQNLPKGHYFADKTFGVVFNHKCHTFMKNREFIHYKSPIII